MKRLTVWGLMIAAVVAALSSVAASDAVAGSVFCAAQESPCLESNRWATGTTLDFSLKPSTSAAIKDSKGNSLQSCTASTIKGKIENPKPSQPPPKASPSAAARSR